MSASTGMRFKEQRAIQRRRKNLGHFITRLFLKGRPGNDDITEINYNNIISNTIIVTSQRLEEGYKSCICKG